MKKAYYETNTLIDDWVGKIIQTLKDRKLYDDTIIIYSSDHGDLLGDHGLVYKQCFYEQSVKAPLIIHNPKRFKPRCINSLVESLDLYSTIIDMTGSQPTQETHSKSLLPILEGCKDTIRDEAFSENYFGVMVRFSHYKGVYYRGKEYGELYDLEKDPNELNNLWNDKHYSHVKAQVKDRILKWSLKTSETGLTPVRGDHFDNTPVQYKMKNGAAHKKERQTWQLPFMKEFYGKHMVSVKK